jgi:hypothetical protein
MRILLLAAIAATTAYGPQPRTLQCGACGFWYQEGTGHACLPC